MNSHKVCPWCFGTFSVEDAHDQPTCLERHRQVMQVERQFLLGRIAVDEFESKRAEAQRLVEEQYNGS